MNALPAGDYDFSGFAYGDNRFIAVTFDGKTLFSIDRGQTFKTGTKELVLLDVTKFNRDQAQSTATAAFTSAGLIETVEETVKSTRVLTLKRQKIAPKPKPRVSNNRRDKKTLKK